MFGSVPLKTYLPDGDIDLAVFQEKGPKLRESWPTDLKNYLESETAKAAPQYRIKDVQIINAEVRHLYLASHRVALGLHDTCLARPAVCSQAPSIICCISILCKPASRI